MKALILSFSREDWPASMPRHWHIVDNYISRHVVTAVERTYGRDLSIQEVEFEGVMECPDCGAELKDG
jgi:uncharacterized protein (UPF0212 family)